MCGIVAVLSRPASRRPPTGSEIRRLLGGQGDGMRAGVTEAAQRLAGPAGLTCLVRDVALRAEVAESVKRIDADEGPTADALWCLREDRLATASAVADFLGADAPAATEELVAGWWSIQVALSALDRLEVRGRDSAGIAVIVSGGEPSVPEPEVPDALGRSGSRWQDGNVSAYVYKTAVEVGELGDNTRALRSALATDESLRAALARPGARCAVLAHTRWASVGLITEPNAHPVASLADDGAPWVFAAVNGDIDNYATVATRYDLTYPRAVTTDARVVPGLARRLRPSDGSAAGTFAAAVAAFEGSHAIVSLATDAPGRLRLARRGSGQALYVGLATDAFVVASEPYGLVEQTSSYLRFDGADGGGASSDGRGEVVRLDAAEAGRTAGVARWSYDGAEVPLPPVSTAGITTRDIDRRGYPHFLLKEISESPGSFAKTLRGRLVGDPGRRDVVLDGVLPATGASPRRIVVIGQGTAAVAARAIADIVGAELSGTGVEVSARLASELSGFGLFDDMSDHLVVAVSQSGTTTDTNRTVDLLQARGASVIAVVNRRESDLAARADGVLYTSDGRDVEMSVASTKAFYAQVAAGFLLAWAIADRFGLSLADPARRSEMLEALERLPAAMAEVLESRSKIADIAQRLAPARRHWATVGNGRNRLAAEELRIKLSELCYRSVACDATEDKKHIDLSAEPLILVCAAGLDRSTARDVAKEVAIYAAHRAAPVVFTDDPELARAAGDSVLLPAVGPDMAFVLVTVAGHLFGYEAALAIDAGAEPLRRTRGAIEAALDAAPRRSRRRRGAPARQPVGGDHRGRGTVRSAVASGSLRRSPARGNRGAARRPVPLRHRCAPAGCLRDRLRRDGDAGGCARAPAGRAHRGHRGVDPTRRRHTPPGQDGHRGDLSQRGCVAECAAGRGRPGRGRCSRTPQLRHAVELGGTRSGGGGGHRLHPLCHRRRAHRDRRPVGRGGGDRVARGPRHHVARYEAPGQPGAPAAADEGFAGWAPHRSRARNQGRRHRGRGAAARRVA